MSSRAEARQQQAVDQSLPASTAEGLQDGAVTHFSNPAGNQGEPVLDPNGNQATATGHATSPQTLAESHRNTSSLGESSKSCASGQTGKASQSGVVEDPVCRVCLGILPSLDGLLQPVSAEMLPQLSERDGGGAPWSPVQSGDVSSIAKHIRYVCALFLTLR